MKILRRIISYYRSSLVRGSFGHNVFVMFTGTALGQCITALLAPLLTRIYSPAMFGLLGIFAAVVGIPVVLASLRYEMALPLVKSDEEATNLLGVCIVSLFATTAVSVVLVLALSVGGQKVIVLGPLMPYRWWLPAGFFCVGAYQAMIFYATWQHDFHAIARTKIFQGITGPLSQIALGLSGAGVSGLIIGFIVGQATGIKLLFARLVMKSRALSTITFAGMKAVAIRFRHFPLVSSWSGLMEVTGDDYLLLTATPLLYSSTIAGFVFLTDRIIGRPLLLISSSILQVYVGDVGKSLASDPAAVRHRFLQLAGRQLVIVAGWLLVVNVVAPYAVPVIFGQEWAGAVPYLHVLSIAYLPQMVIHAMAHTLQMVERQGLSALWQAGRLIALVGVFATSHARGLDALHALLAYSITQAVAQLILFLLMYQSVQSLQKEVPNAA